MCYCLIVTDTLKKAHHNSAVMPTQLLVLVICTGRSGISVLTAPSIISQHGSTFKSWSQISVNLTHVQPGGLWWNPFPSAVTHKLCCEYGKMWVVAVSHELHVCILAGWLKSPRTDIISSRHIDLLNEISFVHKQSLEKCTWRFREHV